VLEKLCQLKIEALATLMLNAAYCPGIWHLSKNCLLEELS